MSNNRLRWLLWAAVLIGCWVLLLDWRDELEPVQKEAHTAMAKRDRELASMKGDWINEASRAREARIEWRDRFVEADTSGLMRVTVLEHVKALCEKANAGCTIGLIGSDTDVRPTAPASSAAAQRSDGTTGPAGTRAIQVKATFAFSPLALIRLLRVIEAADKLTSVDRLLISGQRAELQLSVFAVDATEGRKLRSAASADKGNGS